MVHQLQCSSSIHTLLLSLSILLLVASSMELAFSDARSSPPRLVPEDTGGADKPVTADSKKDAAAAARSSRGMEETGGRQRRRALIGSRPPRCERVCMSCGHCEAVQVPIVPQQEKEDEEEKARAAATVTAVTVTAAMFTYRVEGITTYKPLSWKCWCGGTILDP